MDEVYKNRLAEEVNILYVAVTRAKNKLLIPAEINPLKSIELAPAVTASYNSQHQKNYTTDWDIYSRSMPESQNAYKSSKKTSNHGKRWTEEEEDQVAKLYGEGIALKEIAKKLGRGKWCQDKAYKYRVDQ